MHFKTHNMLDLAQQQKYSNDSQKKKKPTHCLSTREPLLENTADQFPCRQGRKSALCAWVSLCSPRKSLSIDVSIRMWADTRR